jgi:hypothetical protein
MPSFFSRKPTEEPQLENNLEASNFVEEVKEDIKIPFLPTRYTYEQPRIDSNGNLP